MWPHPTLGDYDFNKFESKLFEVASTQTSAFLAKLLF